MVEEETKIGKEKVEEGKKARRNFEDKLKEIAPGPIDGRNELKPIYVEAHTIEDAWRQCLIKTLTEGYAYLIDKGSFEGNYRLGFDYATIRIKHPEMRPLHPIMPEGSGLPPPTDQDSIEKYFAKYIFSDEKTGQEQYTYGERMVNPKARLEETLDLDKIKETVGIDLTGKSWTDDQIKKLYPHVLEVKRDGNKITLLKEIPHNVNSVQQVIDNYKNKGYGSNQEILQVGAPADIVLPDPPCLRHIDTRIRYTNGDNNKTGTPKLNFMVYFRSWDLYGGLPENLAGIQLLKEYMASEIGVQPGETIAASKGLHIYQYVGEIVEALSNGTLKIKDKK